MAKHSMGKTRKVDKVSNNKGGLLNALRRRRIAVETDNLASAPDEFTQGLTGHIKREPGKKRNR